VARVLVDAGVAVLIALISPFRKEREVARNLFTDIPLLEACVDTPLEDAEARDVNGARTGALAWARFQTSLALTCPTSSR